MSYYNLNRGIGIHFEKKNLNFPSYHITVGYLKHVAKMVGCFCFLFFAICNGGLHHPKEVIRAVPQHNVHGVAKVSQSETNTTYM